MAVTEIDDDITIAPTTFADNPVDDLPPPPTNDGSADLSAAPVFTPMTVRPEIRNRSEVQAALMRLYPPILRDAGIGGSVTVWFFISDEGTVLDSRISESSGHAELDAAALRVADVFQFTPATNRDEVVQVWIQLPITFQVQGR
jgi:protein TonB